MLVLLERLLLEAEKARAAARGAVRAEASEEASLVEVRSSDMATAEADQQLNRGGGRRSME